MQELIPVRTRLRKMRHEGKKGPETAMLRGNAVPGQKKAGAEGTFAPVKGDFAPNDAVLAAGG
jgi:hypothetical protein